MGFTLLPAVDVADGRVARAPGDVVGGDNARSGGVVGVSPREAVRSFQADGAQWIHLVDLDAAYGRGSNADLLAELIAELDVNVELAGGIRDEASLRSALATSCSRVVIGTAALENPGWCRRVLGTYGERLAFSLDVTTIERPDGTIDHRLVARGRPRDVGSLWDTISSLDRAGCVRYIVTDVSRDGGLLGPNVDLYRTLADATSSHVIASGGVSSIDDLRVLAATVGAHSSLEGAIVGSALAARRFTLLDALAATRHL